MILIVDNQPAKAELLQHELEARQLAASEDIYVFTTAHQCRKWLIKLLERAWGQTWKLFPPHGDGVVIISDLNVTTHKPFFGRKEQRRDNLRDLQHIRRRLGVKAHILIYTHHPVGTWDDAARAAGADALAVKGECNAQDLNDMIQKLQWECDHLRSKLWHVVRHDYHRMQNKPHSPQFMPYVDAVMRHATYKQLDDGTYFGSVPGYIGMYRSAPTLEACRSMLRGALEQDITDRLDSGQWLPIVNSININRRPIKLRDRIERLLFGDLAQ